MNPKRNVHYLSRRKFVAFSAGALATAGAVSRVWGSGKDDYSGKCLVTLQLDGGADVTQLCDPKINTLGEKKINNFIEL